MNIQTLILLTLTESKFSFKLDIRKIEYLESNNKSLTQLIN